MEGSVNLTSLRIFESIKELKYLFMSCAGVRCFAYHSGNSEGVRNNTAGISRMNTFSENLDVQGSH